MSKFSIKSSLVLILGLFLLTVSAYSVNMGTIPPERGCRSDCLVSANINLKPYEKGDMTVLQGSVLIVDEGGKPVPGAVVIVRWKLPDGTTFRDRVETDGNGFAVVEIPAMQHGMYNLDVLRADKPGYRFDHHRSDCNAEYWM